MIIGAFDDFYFDHIAIMNATNYPIVNMRIIQRQTGCYKRTSLHPCKEMLDQCDDETL